MAKKGTKKKKTTWVFDIDTEKFKKKAKEARKKINEIGDPKNLQGLTQGLVQVTAGSVAFIAVAKILDKTLDLAFRADRIKEINFQFDQLTEKVGIAGGELKFQLAQAADGLISTNDLLEITNKAIISIGKTAGQQMPKLIDLANKISATMGGELKENLDAITMAIQTGSVDTFKNMGLLIDLNQAQREYAKTLGVTVDVLDEQGKQQAILNAVLDKGAQKFKDVDGSLKKNIDTWSQLKISITEFGDAFSVVFEKTIGPGLQKYLKSLRGWVGFFKNEFLATFDEGALASQIRIKKLQEVVRGLNAEQFILQKSELRWFENAKTRETFVLVNRDKLRKATEALTAEQEKLNETIGKQPTPKGGEGPEAGGVDLEKAKTRQAKFEQELLALKQARITKELQLNTSLEQADVLHKEQRSLIEEDFQNKLEQLRAREEERLITADERRQLEVELEGAKNNALIEQERNLESVRRQSLDNHLKQSKSAAEGFQKAFKVAGQKAVMDMKDFGKQSTFAVTAFSTQASSALLALGAGTKNVGEAMKSFMLGALADIAENHGKLYLLQAFTNPALGAAGAGLIVLAGFLRSQAGGGGGGGPAVAAGGGGVTGQPVDEAIEDRPMAEETEKKKIEINFHGDYLDSAETQARFVDIIREAGDVQEFEINKIT